MGIRCNRRIINGHIRYNMFVNDPCYDISRYGYDYLLSKGFHAYDNPYVDDIDEQFLLKYGYLKCISLPTLESQYDQLNYESLYNNLLS